MIRFEARLLGLSRRMRGLGRVALPLLASGCSFAPHHDVPPLPVPGHYADQPASPSRHDGIGRIGWQDFFRDASLRRLIETALAENRDIRIEAAKIAEARAAWRIAGAPLYPQLDAVGAATRGRSIISLPSVGTQAYDVKQVTAQLSAGWEIDFWGRLRDLDDAARNQYLASEEARRAVAVSLIAQVANGYLLEREYQERERLARDTIATREETLRIMRRRYEVGSGSKLDMMQAETLLAQAQTALQALEQDQAVNRNALALLVGEPVAIPPGTLDDMRMGGDDAVALPPGLPSDLLDQRPDIIAAEYALRAADANIGAARAAFFPNIKLTGAYGTGSAALDGLFADGSRIWSFAPTISLPIFNAGRLKGNLDVARARQVRAVADYEKTVQGAFRDVSDALVRRRQLALQIETTRGMRYALKERARLAQLRFDNGRSTYLEVLDAQRDLFGTEQSLVQLRRAWLASGVALYAAVGGGFPNATPSSARSASSAPTGQQMGTKPR